MDFKVDNTAYTTLDCEQEEFWQLLSASSEVYRESEARRKETKFNATALEGIYYGAETELFYEKNSDGEYVVKFAPDGGRITAVNPDGSFDSQITSELGGYVIASWSGKGVLIETRIFDKNRNLSFRRKNVLDTFGRVVKEEDFYGDMHTPSWITEISHDSDGCICFMKTSNHNRRNLKTTKTLFRHGKVVSEVYNDRNEKFSCLSTYSYTPENQIHMIIEKQIHPDSQMNKQFIYRFDYNERGNLSKVYINRHGYRLTLMFAYDKDDRLVEVKEFNCGKVASATTVSYKERNGERFAVLNNNGYVWTTALNKVFEQFVDPFPPVNQKGEYCRY